MDEEAESPAERQRGIQSVDQALRLLKTLGEMRGPVTLTELARRAGMPASKAHRYLASFLAAGIAAQRHRSGQYALGPLALELGLSAMDQLDQVNRVADRIGQLATDTGATTLLAIWGSHGPTVVRWERSASMLATSLGLGSTLPLLNSASGRVFLAYLPRAFTRSILQAEVAERKRVGLADIDISARGIKALVEQIKSTGYATVGSQYIPGLYAASIPILDWQGEVTAAVTLISTESEVVRADGKFVRQLLDFGKDLSTPKVAAASS